MIIITITIASVIVIVMRSMAHSRYQTRELIHPPLYVSSSRRLPSLICLGMILYQLTQRANHVRFPVRHAVRQFLMQFPMRRRKGLHQKGSQKRSRRRRVVDQIHQCHQASWNLSFHCQAATYQRSLDSGRSTHMMIFVMRLSVCNHPVLAVKR